MKNILKTILLFYVVFVFSLTAFSQAPATISWHSIPPGYTGDSILLGAPFSGAITSSPNNPDILYVSVGTFRKNKIVKVNLTTKDVFEVTGDVFGSIGGMAVLPTEDLIIIDNDDNTTNPLPGECVLIAKDLNSDGDFKDTNEIVKLIDPILIESGTFTGAQARVVPSGGVQGIPGGSLMYQDADGSNFGDLFVVINPTSSITAQFRPSSGSFFRGFDYNGGFDFTSSGIIYSASTTSAFHGIIYALNNLNGNERIDAGEWNDAVSTTTLAWTGVSDLIIDGEDDVFFTSSTFPYPSIMTFHSLADPLNQRATPTIFASADSAWLSAICINTKSRSFEPNEGPSGATLIVSGYTNLWASAMNLLTLTPSPVSRVDNWMDYK